MGKRYWIIDKVTADGATEIDCGDYSEASATFCGLMDDSQVLYLQLRHDDGDMRRQFVRRDSSVLDLETE